MCFYFLKCAGSNKLEPELTIRLKIHSSPFKFNPDRIMLSTILPSTKSPDEIGTETGKRDARRIWDVEENPLPSRNSFNSLRKWTEIYLSFETSNRTCFSFDFLTLLSFPIPSPILSWKMNEFRGHSKPNLRTGSLAKAYWQPLPRADPYRRMPNPPISCLKILSTQREMGVRQRTGEEKNRRAKTGNATGPRFQILSRTRSSSPHIQQIRFRVARQQTLYQKVTRSVIPFS